MILVITSGVNLKQLQHESDNDWLSNKLVLQSCDKRFLSCLLNVSRVFSEMSAIMMDTNKTAFMTLESS